MLLKQHNHGVYIKKLILIFSLVLTASLSEAAYTFNEIFLKKDMKNTNEINFVVHTSFYFWCERFGNALDVGSFKVAQQLEALEDGTYKCTGEFAKFQRNPLIAFTIDNCTALDATELKLKCDNQ